MTGRPEQVPTPEAALEVLRGMYAAESTAYRVQRSVSGMVAAAEFAGATTSRLCAIEGEAGLVIEELREAINRMKRLAETVWPEEFSPDEDAEQEGT